MAFVGYHNTGAIVLSSGSGDWRDVVTMVADIAVMDEPTTGNFEIYGNRYLYITETAQLDDAGAYEDGSLTWATRTANGTSINIQYGGYLTVTSPGFILDFDLDAGATYAYMYVYGNCFIHGTALKPVIIKHYYRVRCWANIDATGIIGMVDFDYVDFQSPSEYSPRTNSAFWLEDDNNLVTGGAAWRFTHITLSNRTNGGYFFIASSGDWSRCVIEDITTDDTYYAAALEGVNMKFTRWVMRNVYSNMSLLGNGTGPGYPKTTVYADADRNVRNERQPKTTFDTCTFQDCNDSSSTGKRGLYGLRNTVVKLKACTFAGVDAVMNVGIDARNGGRVLLQGGLAGQTWINVAAELYWYSRYDMGYYEVYELDLTVLDGAGSPLEGASVSVIHKGGNERHFFLTDANGNIKDCHDDDPVFVYGEILSNTPTYDLWSDGIGDKVHTITISHPDYTLDTREVAFTENKTIVAQLTETPAGATTIHGSTIYGSTIH